MRTFYIGRFPHPYGGVTIKNKMLYENILQHIDIEKIDLGLIKSVNFKEIVKLITSLINPSNTFIIGSASTARKFLSWLLYSINRKALNRSLLIVMGGVSSMIIANDPKYAKWVKEYKQVYVETDGMKSELATAGVTNVSVFPNCRERPQQLIKTKKQDDKRIKCLYFSLISKDKGADIVLESAELMSKREVKYCIDFYGHIEYKYKAEFETKVESLVNTTYCGVFSGNQSQVFEKLSHYDLLILPTKCKTEGIPGVLVEAKIASLPAIVSDVCYNADIVEDGVSGVVMKENKAAVLAVIISNLQKNRNVLANMSKEAGNSAEYFYIDNHINKITLMLIENSMNIIGGK